MRNVVVVGASLAGLRAVEALRAGGFEGAVHVIGAELHRPYDRPPLSKKVLAGEWEPDRIALRAPDAFDSLDATWRLGRRATALDIGAREVALEDGERVPYDGLVIATGATPRRLPGQPDDARVVVLRTLDDSLALRSMIAAGTARVVVIGAGFIGLEAAATARELGNDVVVLEGLSAPLERALGSEMGASVAAAHDDHGVDIRCGVSVTAVEPGAVHLADGETLAADVVLVGIGVRPATAWLEGSGLDLRDGVVCDESLSTGAPGVYAAGDLARWHNPLFDEEMRVEHWTNAAEQGAHAAANLLADAHGEARQPYAPVPFFWSDQYDRRIQFLGRAAGDDDVQIVAGSVEERQFVALYGRDGRFRGVLGVNLPRKVMPLRKLLLEPSSFADAVAAATS